MKTSCWFKAIYGFASLKIVADAQMVNNPTPRQKYVLQNQSLAAKVYSYAGSVYKLAYLRAVAHIFNG